MDVHETPDAAGAASAAGAAGAAGKKESLGSAAGARSLCVDAALRVAIEVLYADAAAALDERRYDDWVALFCDDCEYVLQPRENFDRGLPLATMRLESGGMLRDRIRAIGDTLFHAPYYQRHVVGPLRIVGLTQGGAVDGASGEASADGPDAEAHVQANYAVFRTGLHEPTEVFNVGRYIDVLRREAVGWRIRSRRVVFDSELVPNSIIYPI